MSDLPGEGEALALSRTIGRLPDPIALYERLAGGPDTLLLESLDARTKEAERTFLIPRAALRAECRGRVVSVAALTPVGRQALPTLARWLAERAEVSRQDDVLSATYPPPPTHVSEEERLAAPSPFDALRALATRWTLRGPTAVPTLLVAGVFAYDMLGVIETLPDEQHDPLKFPDFQFWLPEQLVILDHKKRSTTVVGLALGGEDPQTSYGHAMTAVGELAAAVEESAAALEPPPAAPEVSSTTDLTDETFAGVVADLKERIVAGDVFQIVPSRTFSAPCAEPLAAYRRLRVLNPSPYMFFVRARQHTLFGASPETCVKVTGSTVEIRPIAGTARRGRTAEGELDLDLDGRLEAELRLSEKEVAEHMMLIDLARNDVARVSKPGSRYVPHLLTVDRYSHVMHLVSYVEGELKPGLDALHAYAASMNMGTLVGAPKLEAARILRERETTRRGPYGGAVGYLTCAGDLDTAIVIRSALVKEGTAYVRAGAGVVADSDPASEAEETRRKAQAVLKALGAS